jgi:hypothetical protein
MSAATPTPAGHDLFVDMIAISLASNPRKRPCPHSLVAKSRHRRQTCLGADRSHSYTNSASAASFLMLVSRRS